jgi:hypothetical protein
MGIILGGNSELIFGDDLSLYNDTAVNELCFQKQLSAEFLRFRAKFCRLHLKNLLSSAKIPQCDLCKLQMSTNSAAFHTIIQLLKFCCCQCLREL